MSASAVRLVRSSPLAGFFPWRWAARDDVGWAGPCGGGGICFGGTTAATAVGLIFTSLTMIFLAVTVGVAVSRCRGRFTRDGGIRGLPGGRFLRHAVHPVPPGAGRTVVYDPDIPGDAIVLGGLPDAEEGHPSPAGGHGGRHGRTR